MIPEGLFCVLLFTTVPQELVPRAGSDPVLVGRPVRLTLEGSRSLPGEWEFPAYGAELDTFLFLSGGRDGDLAWCEVMPTVSGSQLVPPIGVRVRFGPGAVSVRNTVPVSLSVGSALLPGEPARLMDQLELERFDRNAWVWLWLLPLIVVGWVTLRRLFGRRAVPAARLRRSPRTSLVEDPRAIALAELEQLGRRGQPAGEAARLLLADLADVLRRYLSASVDADWMFKTIDELEAQLAGLDRETADGWPGQLLREAELAKFAGRIPESNRVGRLLENSSAWVRSRKSLSGSAVR